MRAIGLLILLAPHFAEANEAKPIVAVFDIEDCGAGVPPDKLNRLSAYLASSIAATGAYRVVPRAQLRARIQKQKSASYKQCYDASCQIEIGREMAAQKSLATELAKFGDSCRVNAVLYDLRTAASQGGARAAGGCNEADLVATLEKIITQLVPERSQGANRASGRAEVPAQPFLPPSTPSTAEPQDATASAPFYKRWWFWTAVGVAVAGGTVAAIAATTGGDDRIAGGADGRFTASTFPNQ